MWITSKSVKMDIPSLVQWVLAFVCCLLVDYLDAKKPPHKILKPATAHLRMNSLFVKSSAIKHLSEHLVVDTTLGKVFGKRERVRIHGHHTEKPTVDTFKGIPFAEPPVNELRFKAPIPKKPWPHDKAFNASQLGLCCIQGFDLQFDMFRGVAMWNPNNNLSENCLIINVWVPNPRPRKSAVMAWIFGGGFASGSSTLDVYDGSVLAATQNVIVVSMNYRLSALGFLYLGIPEAPGNMGLLDQRLALQWVQQNIERFGGDPANVTIFGESAGSVSVSLHLLSPLSQGLFSRAILESGGATAAWSVMQPEEAIRRSLKLAAFNNCSRSSYEEVAACLRGRHSLNMVKYDWDIVEGIMQWAFVPVIDGVVIPEDPMTILKRKAYKRCPVLIGANRDEGTNWILYEGLPHLGFKNDGYTTRPQYDSSMYHFFRFYPHYPHRVNSAVLDAIRYRYRPWYSPDNGFANKEALDDAVGDYHFVCSTLDFAYHYSLETENVYYYYFTHRSSQNPWPEWMGVMHGDEIMYVFGEPLLRNWSYTHEERVLSRRMMQYFSNFAKTGDPNIAPSKHSLKEWPSHTTGGREYMELNVDSAVNPDKSSAIGRGPRLDYCAFWTEYLPQLAKDTDYWNYSSKSHQGCTTSGSVMITSLPVIAVTLLGLSFLL